MTPPDALPTPSTLPAIETVALLVVRDRRALVVRARHREVLYVPGGKIDAGETPVEALVRESREELGVAVLPDSARYLFTIEAQAHGEPEGRSVRMRCFTAAFRGEPRASSEVDELHWVATADAGRCPPAGRQVLHRLAAAGLID